MTSTQTSPRENWNDCRAHVDRFFDVYPNSMLHERTARALRLVAAGETLLIGKPESWAAGAIYAVANLDRQACGVPGLVNSEFAEFFGVSMETVRLRAAYVLSQISI